MVAQLAALSQFSGMLEHLRQTELYSHLSFLEEENFSYPPSLPHYYHRIAGDVAQM